MGAPGLSRRDFLKLSAILPLISMKWPQPSAGLSFISGDTPNILFLVFDTLSAKHTSLAGYPRPTTPNLDRLAERSNVYHRCYSGGNFTTPGTASLLTGTYPWSHRAFHMHGVPTDEYRTKNLFGLLSDRFFTIAYTHNLLVTSLLHHFRGSLDVLKPTRDLCLYDDEYSDLIFEDDYNASFWGEWLALRGTGTQPSSLLLSLGHRILRFWHKSRVRDVYGDQFPRGIPSLHSLQFIPEDATDWMVSQLPQLPEPFLAYIHLLPPHEPYSARRDFVDLHRDGWSPDPKPEWFFSDDISQRELNRQRRFYDEYLSYADAELGRLMDGLEQRGLWDKTLLVFTSDHGELFERGLRGHVTQALFDPVIHVPLLISSPGQQQRSDFRTPVSTVDILPTLLEVAGAPIPEWIEGEVLPGFGEVASPEDRPIYAVEAKSNAKGAPLTKRTLAVILGSSKLIDYAGYGDLGRTQDLFLLDSDPDERTNLASKAERDRIRLLELLQDKLHEVDNPYG